MFNLSTYAQALSLFPHAAFTVSAARTLSLQLLPEVSNNLHWLLYVTHMDEI